MCFISFIVPVYNLNETEVAKCVESIICQTYNDYEVIIVDDGSTNGIEKFCDKLAEQHGIRVIHQENQGLAVARNSGMKIAQGEWIVHVDGDDWVDIHLAEELKTKSLETSADIIVWGFVLDSGGYCQTQLLNDKHAFEHDYTEIKEKVLCSILDANSAFASLSLNTSWAKAYRREFILSQELYYNPKLRRAQDAVYNLYAFSAASKIDYIDKALNYYRNDNISLSRGYNPRTFVFLQATALAANEFCRKNKKYEGLKYATAGFVQRCFRMINEQSFMHKDNKDSYSVRKAQFINAIESEPFRSAFAIGSTRLSLFDKIADLLYIQKCFGTLSIYNKCFAYVYRLKKSMQIVKHK